MSKKLIAILLSVVLCVSLMIPVFALDLGGLLGGGSSSEDSADDSADSEGGFDIGTIMNSDLMQGIMSNENVIDITNIVIELLATYNQENLQAMGQEKAEQLIASTVDTITGAIVQVYDNKDLIITYDPLEVADNLFDLDSQALTTMLITTTEHPDELVLNKGDVDGDGRITAADARLVLRRAAQLVIFTAEQEERADVDGDGKVTAADARFLLRVSADLETLED